MEIEKLKREIPFKWRVQSTNQYGSNCVAYIDSRDVQDLLDEVCLPQNWQVVYEEHKGNLFAKIGILFHGETSGWVWKSDCGTESQVEKQKGEASDAFKRAAVMWGVGRFLYSKKIIKIKEVIQEGNKWHPAQGGKRIWDVNKYCNDLNSGNKKVEPKKVLPTEWLAENHYKTLQKPEHHKSIPQYLERFKVRPEQKQVLDLLVSKLNLEPK